ncbi:MAG: hemolysin family protein [Chloroflexota bacterium]|nr:hemolysin family protein [Chloroflexota bacterium]
MDSTSILYLVLLFICVGASAFFSSAETAFISLPKTRVKYLVESGTHGSQRVEKILEHPEKLLATILLCNNLVNVAAASLGTAMAVKNWSGDIGILISTILVTIVLLIFAEVTPKTVALRNAERMALIYVYPIQALNTIVSPLAIGLSWIGTLLVGGKNKVPKTLVSEEEIRSMISVGREEGTVEESEAELLHKVFEFGDRSVREVMTPRPEVIWIEEGTKLVDFLVIYADFPHSRFPVYRDSIDHVIGILSVKDVLMAQARGVMDQESILDKLVRLVYFVPETKRIAQLFGEMQSQNYHMVVVVDEFGVTGGIVTMDQLVGEIVGEMGDELVKADKDFEVIDDKTVQIDGGMRIEEANQELGLNLPDGDYDTVAGFLLHLLGHIPEEGEQVRYGDMKMVVTQMRELRIEKILVTRE